MINHIHAVTERSAVGLAARVYAQIREDFGRVVEPFQLHSPSPRLLAAAWMAAREAQLAGRVPRALKEIVAVAVSRINACPYCVDAHVVMLHALGEHGAAQRAGSDDVRTHPDDRVQDIAAWAAATLRPGDAILQRPPFSLDEAPEIIGTAVFYHYINRMVQVLLSGSPLPAQQRLLKGLVRRLGGLLFKDAAARPKEAGTALTFLPAADLPDDLQWAQGSPAVAGAFARLAAVIAELAEEHIPGDVRQIVEARIISWRGAHLPLDQAGRDEPLLDEHGNAAAHLAAATALAPYRVVPSMVECYRSIRPGDEALLALLAWASFTAARRVGTWLPVPAASSENL